jgi:hypothetical protein
MRWFTFSAHFSDCPQHKMHRRRRAQSAGGVFYYADKQNSVKKANQRIRI